MKTRLIIIACWTSVLATVALARLLPDYMPVILPGIVLLFFRIFIPSASRKFKLTAMFAFLAANALFFIPNLAAVSALVFLIAIIWSDILVFKRQAIAAA
jgi:hypothetical protein